jgi:hypothetical protein
MLLGASISLWPVPRHHKLILLQLWLVRCLITLGAMLLYESRYQGLDSYMYVDLANEGWMAWSPPWAGGTSRTFMLVWLHHQVVGYHYHAVKVSFSLAGLVAVYIFYRAACTFVQQERPALLYLLGLYPSILFWSSIIGKEPLAMLGFAIYMAGVIAWYQNPRLPPLLLVMMGIALVTLLRPWMGLIMCVPLVVFLGCVLRARRNTLSKIIIVVLMLAGLRVSSSIFTDISNFTTTSAIISRANLLAENMALGDSAQGSDLEFETMRDIFTFMPRGAFTALFRPLPGDVLNPFGLVASVENLGLLLLTLVALSRSSLRRLRHPVVLWALLLLLLWAGLYGFASYYNFGTAVRYRMQILPVLLCLLLYLAQPVRQRIARQHPRIHHTPMPRGIQQ